MEYFSLYGLFLAKVVTIVLAIGALVVLIFANSLRRGGSKGALKISDLGELYRDRQREMQRLKMNEAEHKAWTKAFKKQRKNDAKKQKLNAKAGQSGVKNRACMYWVLKAAWMRTKFRHCVRRLLPY